MINNRQNGRRRGRGGGGNGGGGQRNGNPGRPDNGNRIDSRARGNASQLYEKYKNLASDAQRQGDRVNTEYYLQFADHYFRVLNESRSRFDDQQQRRPQPEPFDDFDDGEEFADEGEPIRAGEQMRDYRGDRDERGAQDRNAREDRSAREERGGRDDRQGYGREERNGRSTEPQREAVERNGYQTAGVVGEADQRNDHPVPVANDVGESALGAGDDQARRGRRGRRTRTPTGETGGEVAAETPAALEADRLPPALGDAEQGGEATEAPKRRRRARSATAGDEAPQAAE